MLLKNLGGEFALIQRIAAHIGHDKDVIKGIGDDCAVIKISDTEWQLITTDMIVENDHFNLRWSTPYQIGMKLMECNVSDIVSMGGKPQHAFLSMSLKKNTTVAFVDEFIHGLIDSAKKHGVMLLGGDTTHGTEYVLNLALTGIVSPKLCRFRSSAKIGDLIAVTGTLGGSTAGLKLLLNQKSCHRESRAQSRDVPEKPRGPRASTGAIQKSNHLALDCFVAKAPRNDIIKYLQNHLEPKSRLVSEGETIARFCNAMIDVSDGLASEVTHIATESKTGARIDYDLIPLSKTTNKSAEKLNMNPYDFALYGGEDFQLVFTLPASNIEGLRKQFSDFTIVGKILSKDQGIFLQRNGKREELKKGYDHFTG